MRNGAEVIRIKVCDDGVFEDPDAMLQSLGSVEESVEPVRGQAECFSNQGDKSVRQFAHFVEIPLRNLAKPRNKTFIWELV